MTEYFISRQGCNEPTPGTTPSSGQLPFVTAIPSERGKAAITCSGGGSGGRLIPAMCNIVVFGSNLFLTRTIPANSRSSSIKTVPSAPCRAPGLSPYGLLRRHHHIPLQEETAQECSSGFLAAASSHFAHARCPQDGHRGDPTLSVGLNLVIHTEKKEEWQISGFWAQPWLN